jgi:hypothetical protein
MRWPTALRSVAVLAALAIAAPSAIALKANRALNPRSTVRKIAPKPKLLGELVPIDRTGDARMSEDDEAERKITFASNDDNRWRANRDLFGMKHSYQQLLGSRFIDKLHTLTAEHGDKGHWLDVGAGELAAIEEYLRDPRFGAGKRMRTTGVAATPIEGWATKKKQLSAWKARGLFGKYLHELSRRQIGKADLLSDVFGAASYADRLDEVIAQYATLLKNGGEAHVVLAPTNLLGSFPAHTTGTQKGAQAAAFLGGWLKTAKGFSAKIDVIEDGEWEGRGYVRLVLTRTGGPIEVGALKVLSIANRTPPIRSLGLREDTLRVSR